MLALAQEEELLQELRRYFDSSIFRRGKEYFSSGLVDDLEITMDDHGPLYTITGVVSGSQTYDVSLSFDVEMNTFSGFECDCPCDYPCKHNVALGLAFIDTYVAGDVAPPPQLHLGLPTPKPTATDGSTKDMLTALLRGEATNAADIDKIIVELQKMKSGMPTTLSSPPRQKKYSPQATAAKRTKEPLLQKYFIDLSRWNGTVSFYRKDRPYQTAGVRALLKSRDCSDTERDLLERILKAQQPHPDHTNDLAKLLILAEELGMTIQSHGYYPQNSPASLPIKIAEEKLSATLKFDPAYDGLYGEAAPRFLCTFDSAEVEKHQYDFIASTEHLVRIGSKEIMLYPMSERLARCMVDALGSRNANDTSEYPLSDRSTIAIQDIITDARDALNLTCDLPEYTTILYDEPKKIFEVDFRPHEQSLTMRACVDYGFVKNEVSQSVLANNAYRHDLKHRTSLQQVPTTHLIQFDGTTIHAAAIDTKLEIELFASLYESPALPYKKPSARLKKLSKIMAYHDTYWQALEKQCAKAGCEIVSIGAPLCFEEKDFRADFTIDIQTENDWLAFDTTLYLGDDKVSLSDVEAFLASGEEFFQQSDGRILRITNRAELERYVALLQRFSRREGKFEGKLYNAPELKYITTSSPFYNSIQTKEFDTFCKQVYNGKPLKRVTLSSKHKKLLRPYQKAGVDWLYFLRSHHFAGILADDMGLGKTLQTLVLLERERVAKEPSLVICPKTLIYNWQAEAKRFTPTLKVAVIDGTPTERATLIKKAKDYDLLITGYATYKIDASVYKKKKIKFNYCVLDEAQFIKNHSTKNAQIVKEVDAKYRLALTGTPLENSVSEVWSMFDFLMPGFLGTYHDFSKKFHTPIMKRGDADALLHLRKKVECFMLRRTKDEVLVELPPKIIQESKCHLTEDQNLLYQEVLTRVKQEIDDVVKEKGFARSGIHILAGITKLRQLCNHPNLLLKAKNYSKYTSTKLDMFNELVNEVRENKRKVLVFSQFTGMLDILAKELTIKDISYCYLSGKTRKRQQLVDTFNNDPDLTVFLISLKAGGTGLNLTSADTVIIFDPWWNPSVENQAIGRAHRMGQTQSVNVYKLVTCGTIEEKILSLQSKKETLFNALVSESKDTFKKLTWQDVQGLFE
ncbi:MAG: DEAD/DEAH box helicase [bacterium]|nr:DEAD/DEAH box helicase [bacterium]